VQLRSIASIIDEILSDGSLKEPSPIERLGRAWARVAGGEIGVLTKVLGFEDGFLLIESMHPAATFEVRSREAELAAGLRSETGLSVSAIRVRSAGSGRRR